MQLDRCFALCRSGLTHSVCACACACRMTDHRSYSGCCTRGECGLAVRSRVCRGHRATGPDGVRRAVGATPARCLPTARTDTPTAAIAVAAVGAVSTDVCARKAGREPGGGKGGDVGPGLVLLCRLLCSCTPRPAQSATPKLWCAASRWQVSTVFDLMRYSARVLKLTKYRWGQ